ncbi:outer membrane protein assembly factor BamE domain-containing protein [Noviherbaspirillum sp. ST9]|uniref:outer membrane protein assembly factor BamE domain-containing protein n=1 Tax=Noviherbaspirillum sp. ST9 TaxID=3401606 RepID=UPI003B589E80
MKITLKIAISAIALSLAGCTTLFPPQVNVGDSEADVLAKRGQPTHRYQDGKDRLMEYALGPWGQKTYMARIGADGRVVSFEQVLTIQKFASIKVGESTKDQVLRIVGGPSETSYLPLRDLEVWSYPYREAEVWNSLMHIHFDKAGVVQQMLNGPDLRFDPDRRFPFGMMR